MTRRSETKCLFLLTLALASLLWVPLVSASDDAYDAYHADDEGMRIPEKMTGVSCATTGCSGSYSEVVDHLMTRDMGEVRILLGDEFMTAWASQASPSCVFTPGIQYLVLNPRQDADGGDGNILTQLLLAKALEGRIFLRLNSDSELGCRLAYMRLL